MLKSRPVTGAAPRMRTRANSVCKARPTRLVMIGYQRKPATPASVLPKFAASGTPLRSVVPTGNAWFSILMRSYRPTRTSCGFQ